MPSPREFSWSTENTLAVRLLRSLFPPSRWRSRRIYRVHEFYKKFNRRFRNLPQAMPQDLQLTYEYTRSGRDKIIRHIFEIRPTKATARISVRLHQQQQDNLSPQWSEKYSDLDRAEVEELYQTMRQTGCIFFETEKGMDVSFDVYYTTSVVLIAGGRKYAFGESTSEPFLSCWEDEVQQFFSSVHMLLRQYKLEPTPVVINRIQEE